MVVHVHYSFIILLFFFLSFSLIFLLYKKFYKYNFYFTDDESALL